MHLFSETCEFFKVLRDSFKIASDYFIIRIDSSFPSSSSGFSWLVRIFIHSIFQIFSRSLQLENCFIFSESSELEFKVANSKYIFIYKGKYKLKNQKNVQCRKISHTWVTGDRRVSVLTAGCVETVVPFQVLQLQLKFVGWISIQVSEALVVACAIFLLSFFLCGSATQRKNQEMGLFHHYLVTHQEMIPF